MPNPSNLINLEDFKSSRLASHHAVSYTGPWSIEKTDEGFVFVVEREISVSEAQRFYRALGALLGVAGG